MNFREFLLHTAKVGDLIWIIDKGGHYRGCTIIDREDLFISSLSSKILDQEAKYWTYDIRHWTIKPVLVVMIE